MIFTPPFSLSGESGKALGAAKQTLLQLNITAAELSLASGEADVLNFTQRLPQDGRTVDVAANEQQVTLWDATGARIFTGKAKRAWNWLAKTYTFTVTSAWAQLAESQLVDGSGVASVTYAAQSLATTLTGMLTAANTAGVPLAAGTVASSFSLTPQTFKKSTRASALMDALAFTPDGMTAMDYTGTGTPKLHISRRGTATVVTLDTGVDGHGILDISLVPYPELVPEVVSLRYAAKNANNSVSYLAQTAGSIGPNNRRQVITLSGPENANEPPEDTYPGVSVDGTAISSVTINTIRPLDQKILGVEAEFGPLPGLPSAPNMAATDGQSYTLWLTGSSSQTRTGFTRKLYGANGSAITSGWYLYTGNVDKQVFDDNGISYQQGTLVIEFVDLAYLSGTPYPLLDSIKNLRTFSFEGWASSALSGSKQVYSFYKAELSVTLINADPNGATLYPALGVDFLQPPAGLAASLLSAQTMVPWKGTIKLAPNARFFPLPGQVVNINGEDPDWTAMKAAVQKASVNLATMAVDVRVGPPPRLDVGNVQNRFRSFASDNYA